MSNFLLFTTEEWRFWRRSRMASSVFVIGLVLLLCSIALTTYQMSRAAHERAHLQAASEQAFLEQPARHPHRMVHYGHYVFREPTVLSMIDPGLDAFTGNSIFLEGHRQNTAMFADRQANPSETLFGALSPALLLQTLAPLMIILLGYHAVVREREARTFEQLLVMGCSPVQMLAGKGLALGGAVAVILLPLVAALGVAVGKGESFLIAALFLAGYVIYLLFWCALSLFVSFFATTRGASLGVLLCIWIVVVLLIPPLASAIARQQVEVPGKIASDFAVIEAAKEKGDGHNAADPAFAVLKANLLAQYDVESIEQLPINFRGVVAQHAEAELTDLLNEYAGQRMQAETEQAEFSRLFGWVSPLICIREFSMIIASVDLANHHRFLREAEAVRYDFVQSLNKVHETQMAYVDDINRSRDSAAEKRTRVSADNWQVLDSFRFQAASVNERLSASRDATIKLLVWLFMAIALCLVVTRRRAL
jgi:ABC-2 type transport system permease protein